MRYAFHLLLSLCCIASTCCIDSLLAKGEIIGILGGTGTTYRIDEHTGQGTKMGKIGESIHYVGFSSLALGPDGLLYTDGKYWRTNETNIYRIDPRTGKATRGSLLSPSFTTYDLAFSPEGLLYAIAYGAVSPILYTLDVSTGVFTEIGRTGAHFLSALDFAPDGTLYGWDNANENGNGWGLVKIEPTTAIASDVSPTDNALPYYSVRGIAFAPDGTLYGAGTDLYTIDVTTGEITLVGPGNYGQSVNGIEFIPEPGTLTLLATLAPLAALGLLRLARHRRRNR